MFRGQKQAVVSSTDLSAEALDELVDRALAMAATVPDDPWCGLAEPDQLSTAANKLDMVDADEPSGEDLVAMARTCEDAARAVDGGSVAREGSVLGVGDEGGDECVGADDGPRAGDVERPRHADDRSRLSSKVSGWGVTVGFTSRGLLPNQRRLRAVRLGGMGAGRRRVRGDA